MSSIDVKVPPKRDEKGEDALERIVDLIKKTEKVLVNGTGESDPTIFDHIALWQEPAKTNLMILSKYIDGLEKSADHVIDREFNKFIDNHNDVLFNVILPRIELLNELNKYINIADRKLGESEQLKVIGRINSIIQKTQPVLENWLSVQNDLESRLKFEKGLATGGGSGAVAPSNPGTGGSKWVGTHIDPFTNSGQGERKVKLDGFDLASASAPRKIASLPFKMDLAEQPASLYKSVQESENPIRYGKKITSAKGFKEAPFGGRRRKRTTVKRSKRRVARRK